MKESQFIEQNKEKWLEFEEENNNKKKDPAKLSRLFVQVTDDLSYARSFYKNRQVRHMLNGMAQNLFLSVYKRDKLRNHDILTFWKTTLPLAIYQVRRELLISFLLFALSFGIGMLSSANDPAFSRMILSEEYVDMTLENIKNGEPLGVYKKMGEMDMMFSITLNNLFVSAITFVLGIFASIGAVMAMVGNGVMVGCFQHFFIERGLFWDSFLTIWQHGTLEISAIIIAGGAGIVLGRGLLFPGTYTRMQAFRISSKKGMVVLAGIAPVIIFAAFIESFFTRYTDLPDIVRLLVIIASLAFVLFYFVFYPRCVARRTGLSNDKEDIEYKQFTPFNLNEVYSGGQIFESVLRFFGPNFSSFFKKILLLSLAYTLIWGVLNYWVLGNTGIFFQTTFKSASVWKWGVDLLFSVISCLIFFYSVYGLSYQPEIEKPSISEFLKRSIFPVIICVGIVSTISFISNEFLAFIVNAITLPYFLCIAFWWQNEKANPIPYFFDMLKGNYSSLFWLIFKFVAIAFLLQFFVSTALFQRLLTGLLWNLYFDEQNMNLFILLFTDWVNELINITLCALASVAVGLFSFNMNERHNASALKLRIEKIGERRSVRGFERE